MLSGVSDGKLGFVPCVKASREHNEVSTCHDEDAESGSDCNQLHLAKRSESVSHDCPPLPGEVHGGL